MSWKYDIQAKTMCFFLNKNGKLGTIHFCECTVGLLLEKYKVRVDNSQLYL